MKHNPNIPAYIIGLWRLWADFKRADEADGAQDIFSDIAAMDLSTRTPSSKSDGPVFRAIMALEAAGVAEAMIVDRFWRELDRAERGLIYRRYVVEESFAKMAAHNDPVARELAEAHERLSMALHGIIMGLGRIKDDELATLNVIQARRAVA